MMTTDAMNGAPHEEHQILVNAKDYYRLLNRARFLDYLYDRDLQNWENYEKALVEFSADTDDGK